MINDIDNPKSISVVIATLGGESLRGTIEQLNRGTILPEEILICIPEEDAYKVEGILFPNVKVIKTLCRGQVAQRAIGFEKATNPMVLQLDDDMCPDLSCLEILIDCLQSKMDASVGPSLFIKKTGTLTTYLSEPDNNSSYLYKLLFKIINGNEGYKPGRVSKAGVGMGFSKNKTNPYEVDWLPGGCVLHFQSNLVNYNFYPFKSKAFAEDLFHSSILKKNATRLYHCPNAICNYDDSSSKSNGLFSYIRIFFYSSRALVRNAYNTDKNIFRLITFLIIYYLIYLPSIKLSFKLRRFRAFSSVFIKTNN